MPDDDDDETVIQHWDDEMTHPRLPREDVSEPTIPEARPAPERGGHPAPRPQSLPAMRPRAPTLKPPVEAAPVRARQSSRPEMPPARARLPSTPAPPGPVRTRAPSIPPPAQAPRRRAPSRPDTAPPVRPPQRSSSEHIADAIASAMVGAQVPATFQAPLVPDLAVGLPFVAPAPVAPVPIADPAPLAALTGAGEGTASPGWVVLYVFVCLVLTALGAAILVWWRLHGLW